MTEQKQGKGGPKNKEETIKRRNEIVEIVKRLNTWNLNKSDLSKKFNVTRDTITRDLKEIGKTHDFSVEDVKLNLDIGYKRAISKTMLTMANPNVSHGVMMQAVTSFNTAAKGYVDMLEAFGIKKKIADDINILSENLNINTTLTTEEKAELLEMSKRYGGKRG